MQSADGLVGIEHTARSHLKQYQKRHRAAESSGQSAPSQRAAEQLHRSGQEVSRAARHRTDIRHTCEFFPRSENKCLLINDPSNRRTCRCHQCLASANRSSTFVPFHRRPRTTPPALSDPSSIRTKSEPVKTESLSEGGENANAHAPTDALIAQSTSSPLVNNPTPSNQQAINDKAGDWTASTPNSVSASGPPSVLAPITNLTSVPTNSPTAASSSSRGLKRSATVAFDELSVVEDDERELHKQTYDFHRTDSFLQLPLKRFRSDTHSVVASAQSSLAINNPSNFITTDHLYRHGQPTPPSPSHLLPRIDPYDFEDDEDSTSRTSYPPSTPTGGARQNQTSAYNPDGPSMADLDTIIDSHDANENKQANANVLSQILSNGGVKSPMRKDNSLVPPPPPPPPPPNLLGNNGNSFAIHKSLNGGTDKRKLSECSLIHNAHRRSSFP